MILFHELLSHCGESSQYNSSNGFRKDLREFSYVTDEKNFFDVKAVTHTPSNFCQKCDKCEKVQEMLVDLRCNNNQECTWKTEEYLPNKSESEYVIGDINSLGWVVLKHQLSFWIIMEIRHHILTSLSMYKTSKRRTLKHGLIFKKIKKTFTV